MADLKTFSGFPVQNLSSDSTSVGQIYYNSTSGQFKAVTAGVGSWASGENTSTPAAQRGSASTGPNTNAFVSGGFNAIGSSVTANAEAYDGTSWSEGPNQPGTNRLGMSWGAAESYVTAGGSTGTGGQPINPYAFEWNNVSFSNGGQLNNARRNGSGAGVSSDSGRAFGGGDNPGPAQDFNEGYNGTAFSNDTVLNTARIGGVGMGTKDLALYTGGASGTPGILNEKWNGSSWTEVGDLTVAVNNSGGRAGTTTSGLVFSKTDPGAQSCQSWDGVSWATQSAQAVNRYNNTGSGPDNTNAISVGGYGPPAANQTATEEWTAADFEIKSLTTS